jgi:hypothetical protein
MRLTLKSAAAVAALILLTPLPAAAQGAPQSAATGYDRGQTIRFPVYDPALGSLEGYRQALIAAVNEHVAHIRAGDYDTAEVAPAVVTLPARSVPASPWSNPIGAMPPATRGRGAVSGSVGTNPGLTRP